MCGRYAIVDVAELYERFGVNQRVGGVTAHYNAAPGMMLPVVTKQSPKRIQLMRWGLIPSWAKDPAIGWKMINARVETVATKPSYRKPLSRQRCLVPANGYYEWKEANGKQPYYFQTKDKGLFAFAGLYDVWKDAEGVALHTFTIITRAATGAALEVHKRMPVILSREDEEAWLSTDMTTTNEAYRLLKATKPKATQGYRVSSAVNSARNESEALIKPLDSDERK